MSDLFVEVAVRYHPEEYLAFTLRQIFKALAVKAIYFVPYFPCVSAIFVS